MPDITQVVTIKWWAVAFWAILGGIMHALQKTHDGQSRTFLDRVILALLSGFAGSMWGLIAVKLFPNDIVLISFISGIGGFSSTEGLKVLVATLTNPKFKGAILELLTKILK